MRNAQLRQGENMSRNKTRILVVDDERSYIRAVEINLEARGYQVLSAEDGQTAIDLVSSEAPDLVLLDLRMPGMDGFEVCRRIRDFTMVPVIMLTALAEDTDKVRGLDTGADDYITKPFSAEELVARVQAVLRRVRLSERRKPSSSFEAGGLQVDLTRRRVFVHGQEVHLTPTEYRLLHALIQQPGQVLVPRYLLEKVWGLGYADEHRLLRQAIHRLRHKIEDDPRNPQYIQNRPGHGYVFCFPE
jgi:two-component system KDP operon response regulator KdpE